MLGIFLDVETTGLDLYQHRVLEIAFKLIDIFSGEEKYVYNQIVKQPQEVWEKRDLDSIKINGFTWNKVLLGKEEKFIGQEIEQIFLDLKIEKGKAIYICQNPAFDRAFFSQLIDIHTQEMHQWPYHWLDLASMYWALQMKKYLQNPSSLPNEISLSKNSIAQKFQLPVESLPHQAINGVNHLILCYSAVVGFCLEKSEIKTNDFNCCIQ